MAALLVYVASVLLLENYLFENATLQRQAVTNGIKQDIEVFDRIQLVVEENWETELEHSLAAIATEIDKHINSGRPLTTSLLTQLKNEYRLSDLHIINRDLVVSMSTSPQEVGLDMKDISDEYTESLRALLNNNRFMTHGTSLSTKTGRLKKYGYYSRNGSNIIVNGDFDVRDKLLTEIDNDIAKYLYGDYVKELETKYPSIASVDLFIVSNSDQWSLFNQGESIDDEEARLIFSGNNLPDADPLRVLERIDMQAYREVGLKAFLDIHFDDALLQETKQNLRFMSLIFIIVIVSAYNLLINIFIKKVVSLRFAHLIKQIRDHADNNDTTLLAGKDELAIISKEVSSMAARIKDEQSRNEELANISYQDSLTGLKNRRWFDMQFESEWERTKHSQNCLSILMIDVDYFKEYNDHYGHVAGDNCLQLLASSIARTASRPTDITARYGGEEFICLLPNTNTEGAEKVACRIREDVETLNIPHERSAIASYVSISVGACSVNGSEKLSTQAILERVDKLLYESKANGRNKITVG